MASLPRGWKPAGDAEGLVEDFHGVAAGDGGGDGEAHGVLEAFDGVDRVALEDVARADGLHAEDGDFFLHAEGEHFLGEAEEVGVHDVERDLHGVEEEAVLVGDMEHADVDVGVFVPLKPM